MLFLAIYLMSISMVTFLTILSLGYSPNHQDYSCYNPCTKKTFIRRNVVFNEKEFPLKSNRLPSSDSSSLTHHFLLTISPCLSSTPSSYVLIHSSHLFNLITKSSNISLIPPILIFA